MKTYGRILFLLVLVATAASPALAQKGFQIGLRVNPVISWMPGDKGNTESDSLYKSEMTYGVMGGLHVGYDFNKYMGIAGQFLYASTGQDHSSWYKRDRPEGGQDTVRILTELRHRNINIPILFRLHTNSERKFSVGMELGPQFGFLTSVDERSNDVRNTHLPFNYPMDVAPDEEIRNYPSRINTYKTFNFSGVLAVGVDVKLRFNLKMNLLARVAYSFGDLEDKDAAFNRYKDGNSEAESAESFYYSNRNRPYYNQDRGGVQNLNLGLMLGFTYIFIPKLHF